MKNKMLKGLTMLLAVVALTFISAVGTVNAQESRTQVASVPFEFTVGDTTLPAGDYNVTRMMNSGETIALRGAESAVRLTSLIIKAEPARRSKLVFHRYGDQYFLAEVWTAGYTNGRKLVTSKAEIRLQRENSRVARDGRQYDLYEVSLAR